MSSCDFSAHLRVSPVILSIKIEDLGVLTEVKKFIKMVYGAGVRTLLFSNVLQQESEQRRISVFREIRALAAGKEGLCLGYFTMPTTPIEAHIETWRPDFVYSPARDPNNIEVARVANIPYIGGVQTLQEVWDAESKGSTIVASPYVFGESQLFPLEAMHRDFSNPDTLLVVAMNRVLENYHYFARFSVMLIGAKTTRLWMDNMDDDYERCFQRVEGVVDTAKHQFLRQQE